MSFDLQVILISNLTIMVIALAGYVVYQRESFRRIEDQLNRRIAHLRAIIEDAETEQLPSNTARQQVQENLSNLSRHQLKMIEALLDMENAGAETFSDEELKQQLSVMKTEAIKSSKLIETLKADNRIAQQRQKTMDSQLEKTTERLEKAKQINNELKTHYQKLTAGYRIMANRMMRLQESKENLEKSMGENTRLHTQLTESRELINRQIAEIESLSQANQAQSKAPIMEDLNQLKEEYDDLEAQLQRTEKEKQFLEDQFIEVVNSLDTKENIEDELQRSKKEYSFLEDRFIELNDAKKDQDESDLDQPESKAI